MNDLEDLGSELEQTRQRFLALVAEVRADLHRYCARMTGSVVDGEDLVQDVLARAYFALPELEEVPRLRPWLFAIAHRRAIDHLRRYEQRMRVPLEAVDALPGDHDPPDDQLAAAEAVHAAVSRFVALPPAQRSAVILKDVLGHTLDEIGELLELSLPAVKAALHRGRVALRTEPEPTSTPEPPSPTFVRYAQLFNARDWDGVRALLSEDVRVDVIARAQRRGRSAGQYTERYDAFHDWWLAPARLEGREVLAVLDRAQPPEARYLIVLELDGGRVRKIRDFRHVPYILRDARLELA